MTEESNNNTKDVDTKKDDGAADTETIKAVVERLKFFFSNANIRQDKFLRNFLVADDANEQEDTKDKDDDDTNSKYPQMVPIEVLLKFNTIKQHTSDPAVVAAAAKELSTVLKVSDDDKAIGRVQAFTMDQMEENLPITIVVENLPLNESGSGYAITDKDIRALLEQYGEIAIVKLRFGKNHGNGKKHGGRPGGWSPLGSALVEFADAEGMAKAVDDILTSKDGEKVEPKRKLTLQEKELQVITLKDFITNRKSKRKNDGGTKEEEDSTPPKTFECEWKPKCVIRVQGLAETCDREAILDAVTKALDTTLEDVKGKNIYVDFSRGQVDGAIRFPEPDTVEAVCEKLASGTVEIAGAKVEKAFVLEGDEEKKYWDDFIAFKNKQLQMRHEQRGQKKRRKFR